MSILTILIVIIVVGVLLWAVNTYVPMQASYKKILNIIAVLILIVWLLKAFGVFDFLSQAKI